MVHTVSSFLNTIWNRKDSLLNVSSIIAGQVPNTPDSLNRPDNSQKKDSVFSSLLLMAISGSTPAQIHISQIKAPRKWREVWEGLAGFRARNRAQIAANPSQTPPNAGGENREFVESGGQAWVRTDLNSRRSARSYRHNHIADACPICSFDFD
jgi:hypothetical protein